MLKILYLMQQTFDLAAAVKYSIGLVTVCLVILMQRQWLDLSPSK